MDIRKGSEYRWNSWVSRCGFLSTIAVENRDHRRISHGEKYLPARNVSGYFLAFQMANRHSMMWRAPGRRSAEREKFRRLMHKVEAVRERDGMTKTELAAELGANVDGVRAWMTGRTIGRKETVGCSY